MDSNPSRGGEIFNFKNYLCKLPVGNKFQLRKNSIEWSFHIMNNSLKHLIMLDNIPLYISSIENQESVLLTV